MHGDRWSGKHSPESEYSPDGRFMFIIGRSSYQKDGGRISEEIDSSARRQQSSVYNDTFAGMYRNALKNQIVNG